VYDKGNSGIAYMKGACWNSTMDKRLMSTSVSEDLNGYFDGAFTVAHEFAHNLGALHDGSGDSAGCPWSDGYIMSYNGWGTSRKFYFSQCSINVMHQFILSKEGACLRSMSSTIRPPITDVNSAPNVGDTFDMLQLCKKYTNQSRAVPDPTQTPGDLCKSLACRYTIPERPGYTATYNTNHPPGDNSPCGNGGRCTDGECVGDKGIRLDMKDQCIKYTEQSTAVPDYSKGPSVLCSKLSCIYTKADQPGWTWTFTTGQPDYGTLCADGKGRCVKGQCLAW